MDIVIKQNTYFKETLISDGKNENLQEESVFM
jgi:hypothetical protein